MPLTADEKLQRRLTDPYYGLAEELAQPSLAQQKNLSVSISNVEKKRALDPQQALADEAAQQDGAQLIDIAESSVRQGYEQLKDFFSGGSRSNVDIAREADIASGVTPEGRKITVGDPQEKVIQSLAKGNYLDAAGQALLAGPATLADSAQVIPELAIGTATTAIGGRALAGRRIKKAKEGIGKIFDRVDEARANLAKNAAAAGKKPVTDVLKAIPKAAGQVSLATADITQRQVNDFRELHGVDPTREEAATMYAINLATMLPTPSIIKNLFIPDFKKQIKTEVGTLVKNIKGGSNFKQIMSRVVDGTKKVTKAGGAEAGQEYFQTWAEAINVQLGPKERETFWKSIQEVIGDEDNQLQALAGSFLGGGAGATARATVSVPAVVAGATVDTAKGTAKTAVKGTVAAVKQVAKGTTALANNAAFKVLSQEERDVIASEFGSRKEIVNAKLAEFKDAVDTVKAATTIETLRENPDIRDVVNARQEELGIAEEDLGNRKTLEKLKAGVIRAYRGDAALLKTELATSNVAAVAKKSAENVTSAATDAAVATVKAVSPGAKAVLESVKQFGDKAVKAAKEIRSSTALGIIEIAANAGKEETKTILEAAKTLSLDDLQRTTAVVSEMNPKLATSLQQVINKKNQALERTGVVVKSVVNKDTLSKAIQEAAKLPKLASDTVASISSVLNKTVAGKIEDLESLAQVESVAKLIEQSKEFKDQTKGAMSRDNMVIVKRKLDRSRARLEKEAALAARSVGEKVKDAVTPVVKDATETVKKKADEVKTTIEASAKKRAQGNVKVSPGMQAATEAVIETLRKPDQQEVLIQAAPDFVKQMKKNGVNNRAEFEVFIDQFPELQENLRFYKALEEQYPTNVVVDEITDVFKTLLLDGQDKIKEAYNKMNPPECKV